MTFYFLTNNYYVAYRESILTVKKIDVDLMEISGEKRKSVEEYRLNSF